MFSTIRRLVLFALAISLLGLTSPLSRPASASTSVSGTVFQDYNLDATRDLVKAQGVAYDRGLAGISVKAFDLRGSEVGSTTTGADGSYTLTISGASSEDLRVEFSWPDSGETAGLKPSFNGSGSGTTIQFVKAGAVGVNLGLNVPGDFCQDNPTLVTCYMGMGAGSTNTKTGAQVFPSAMPTIRQSDYSSTDPLWNTYTGIANSDKLGAVFGIGVDRQRNAFFGTYVRRHIDYGDAGAVNAIYRVNIDNPNVVSTFVTLPGTLPAHDPSFASVTGCCNNNPYTDDKTIFDKVGRIGLGDVDVTPDGKTLLAVDMDEAAPKLYSVPIIGTGDNVTSGTPTSISIPVPTAFGGVSCVGTWHPMGIGVRGSRILVGGVCGAETTVSAVNPRGPAVTQSAAFVLELSGSTFSTIAAFSLGYDRTCSETSDSAGEPCSSSTSNTGTLLGGDWGAWNNSPSLVAWWNSNSLHAANPQAMLANIEIADNGDLIIGLRDRYTDQQKSDAAAYTGAFDDGTANNEVYWNRAGTVSTSFSYGTPGAYSMSTGDIVRMCSNAGTLTLESSGTCSGAVGSANANTNGVREFYFDDLSRGWHSETTMGSLTSMPGYSGVWATAFDLTNWNQQGVVSLGECAAAMSPADCYPTVNLAANNIGSKIGGQLLDDVSGFQKGNALADIEMICDQAPLQIGNRVWIDTDKDGIQDPGETPVAGATVRLYAADGTTLLGTALTNSSGEYYFASNVSEATGGTGDNAGGGIAPGSAYIIRMDNPADYASGGPLEGYVLTKTTATDPITGLDTSVDNNAATVRSFPELTTAVLQAGVNDHTYDIGFNKPSVSSASSSILPVGMGNYVWIDADKDGRQDVSEKPIDGVIVTLFNPDGTPARTIDGANAMATTDAKGYYFIDNLVAGSYYAKFTLPAAYRFTKKSSQGSTSANDSNPDATTGITPVFTIGASVVGDTIADTDSKTTAVFVNPTIDAGVVPIGTVSVGNFVWRDRNGDGVQGKFDSGVAGAVLHLKNRNGSPVIDAFGRVVRPQKTKADGKYLFKNLLPGSYVVEITYPREWYPTTKNRPGRARNSSAHRAVSRVLRAGQSDLTLDFGTVRRSQRLLPGTR